MLESLKNNVRLLRRSKRHVILFELTYKLLAVAVIYPILTAAINLCMKVAGIRYLTNEYIRLATIVTFINIIEIKKNKKSGML